MIKQLPRSFLIIFFYALAAGIFLTGFGYSRFLWEVKFANIYDLTEKIKSGKDFNESDIKKYIERIDAMGQRATNDPDLLFNRALLYLSLVEESKDTDTRKKWLMAAEKDLMAGLRLSPANSSVWTQLAYVEYLLYGPSKKSASAVYMSIKTGPYLPNLLMLRVKLCLVNYQFFTPEQQSYANNQIKTAWHFALGDLVKLSKETNSDKLLLNILKLGS